MSCSNEVNITSSLAFLFEPFPLPLLARFDFSGLMEAFDDFQEMP